MHESESSDGRLFDAGLLSQRVVALAGAREPSPDDEVLYVLEGEGRVTAGDSTYDLRPGTALFVGHGQAWTAEGEGRALSVLVHDPAPPSQPHAALDLTAAERGDATGGRQFVLGATPAVGCESVTQFIGLVPPGRAPDH